MTGRARVRSDRAGLIVLMFAVYLALLVWIVLWKLHAPYIGAEGAGRIKLVPFAATSAAGASAAYEVVANVLIFVPFGAYLRLLAPSWSWWQALGALAAASATLEVLQYVIAVGVSDVTDILANSAGGLAGIALVGRAQRGGRARTAAIRRLCLVGTVLAVIAVGALVVVYRLRLPPL